MRLSKILERIEELLDERLRRNFNITIDDVEIYRFEALPAFKNKPTEEVKVWFEVRGDGRKYEWSFKK